MPNVLKRGGVYAVDDAAKVVASFRALGKDSSEWTRHAEQREHFVRVEMFERLLTKAQYAKFMIEQRLLEPESWRDASAVSTH
jgi:hypothetical protein